jgi:predicted dehydrogenase
LLAAFKTLIYSVILLVRLPLFKPFSKRLTLSYTEVEDTAVLLLMTEDGSTGIIEVTWSLAAGVNIVEIYGIKGAAYVYYMDGTSRCRV